MSLRWRIVLTVCGGWLIWALGGTYAYSLLHHQPMDWVQAGLTAAVWLSFSVPWSIYCHTYIKRAKTAPHP